MGILLHTVNTGIMWIKPWTNKILLGFLRLFHATKDDGVIHACTSHTCARPPHFPPLLFMLLIFVKSQRRSSAMFLSASARSVRRSILHSLCLSTQWIVRLLFRAQIESRFADRG